MCTDHAHRDWGPTVVLMNQFCGGVIALALNKLSCLVLSHSAPISHRTAMGVTPWEKDASALGRHGCPTEWKGMEWNGTVRGPEASRQREFFLYKRAVGSSVRRSWLAVAVGGLSDHDVMASDGFVQGRYELAVFTGLGGG